jgi:hypothetical protein
MRPDAESPLRMGPEKSLRGWKKLPPDKILVVNNPVQSTMPLEIDGQAKVAAKESP